MPFLMRPGVNDMNIFDICDNFEEKRKLDNPVV